MLRPVFAYAVSIALSHVAMDPAMARAQRPIHLAGGFNIASVSGDAADEGNASSKVGFALGVGTQMRLGPSLLLQPEAFLSLKGFKDNTPGFEPATVSLTYVEFPVLVRYNVSAGDGATVAPHVAVGPNVALLLSCSVSDHPDAECEAKTLDVGLTVGAGLEFDVSGRLLGVVLRYQKGVSDIFEGGSAKNTVLQILGTWRP